MKFVQNASYNYVAPNISELGARCIDNSDCSGDNVLCRNQVCTCVDGYSGTTVCLKGTSKMTFTYLHLKYILLVQFKDSQVRGKNFVWWEFACMVNIFCPFKCKHNTHKISRQYRWPQYGRMQHGGIQWKTWKASSVGCLCYVCRGQIVMVTLNVWVFSSTKFNISSIHILKGTIFGKHPFLTNFRLCHPNNCICGTLDVTTNDLWNNVDGYVPDWLQSRGSV